MVHTIEQEIIKATVPAKTETYTPISHSSIISSIENMCEENNLAILDRRYQVNEKLTQVTGKYALSLKDSEIGCMIAWQNSYDKSLSVKMAIGASVFICSNGMVVGENTIKRKHTGDSDSELQMFIKESILNSVDKFNNTLALKEDMKQITLSEASLYELIGGVFLENDILRTEQLTFIRKEYNNPTFNYDVSKNNLWNVYNLFTDAIERKSHPSLYINQNQQITELIRNRFLN